MMYNKPTKIRSKKITQSAKGESCTLRVFGVCNHNNETVVFAHVNANKGIGSKGHDIHGFYSCSSCHSETDIGKVSDSDILRALMETQIKLYNKGLIKI